MAAGVLALQRHHPAVAAGNLARARAPLGERCSYFQRLYDLSPESVGGGLPDDAFYYG
jgi:hypothetical protein